MLLIPDMGTASAPTADNHAYSYDKLNRLVSGTGSNGAHEQNITYDLMGNIKTLNRNQNSSTVVDQLTYDYTGTGNRLNSVADANSNTSSLFQLPGTTSYSYDANGNLTARTNSTNTTNNISSITYNYLNLPQSMTTGGTSITYTYDATGNKLRKQTAAGLNNEYIKGINYENGSLSLQTEAGRVVRISATNYRYEYTLKDHLGNSRVSFDIYAGAARQIQKDDYYPFGLNIAGARLGTENKYLYNGKEIQDETGWYDYGARFYDPLTGRWATIDPLAEQYNPLSPYNYVTNNPIGFIDPDGRSVEYYSDPESIKNLSAELSMMASQESMENRMNILSGKESKEEQEALSAMKRTSSIQQQANKGGEGAPNSAFTMRDNDVGWGTLLGEFLTGKGPEYSGFGADHPMTKDLKDSWIVGIATAKYLLNKGEPLINYDVPFGLVGAATSRDMTEQFVGGARISIIPSSAGTIYIVNNSTGRYSYRLHMANDVARAPGTLTPEGTIYQRFMWIVK